MKKAPSTWDLSKLSEYIQKGPRASRDGSSWYPARPEGYFSLVSRIKAAWLVFKGKADALVWPEEQ